MNPLRRLLLVVLLLCAQLAAGAHAVEHAAGDDNGLPTHACPLCLAGHDLGAALPSLAALLPVPVGHDLAGALPATGRFSLTPPPASQRGPPPRLL